MTFAGMRKNGMTASASDAEASFSCAAAGTTSAAANMLSLIVDAILLASIFVVILRGLVLCLSVSGILVVLAILLAVVLIRNELNRPMGKRTA